MNCIHIDSYRLVEGLTILVFTDVSAGSKAASREGKSDFNFCIIACTACSFSNSR